jgi:hypothetical protein
MPTFLSRIFEGKQTLLPNPLFFVKFHAFHKDFDEFTQVYQNRLNIFE